MGVSLEIIFVLLLTLLNGIFAMSELAVVSSRKGRLLAMERQGSLGAAAAIALQEDPQRFLPTVQVGITLVGILGGVFGGAAIAGANAGRNAGNVTIDAGGAITALGAITASGSAATGGVGGNAGTVSVTGAGGIAGAAITASGGAAAGTNMAGGNAGNITVANSGSGSIVTGALAASNGAATGTGTGGTASAISVTNTATGGGITTAAITTTGAANGAGANVNLDAQGAVNVAGLINTSGGARGTGATGTYASITAKYALPFLEGLSISGELGHYWLGRTNQAIWSTTPPTNLPDYLYWNAGISYTYKNLTADVRYHDTNLSKRECFLNTTDPRGVINGSASSKWCGPAVVGTLSFDITASSLGIFAP
eukprot:gene41828-51060_t